MTAGATSAAGPSTEATPAEADSAADCAEAPATGTESTTDLCAEAPTADAESAATHCTGAVAASITSTAERCAEASAAEAISSTDCCAESLTAGAGSAADRCTAATAAGTESITAPGIEALTAHSEATADRCADATAADAESGVDRGTEPVAPSAVSCAAWPGLVVRTADSPGIRPRSGRRRYSARVRAALRTCTGSPRPRAVTRLIRSSRFSGVCTASRAAECAARNSRTRAVGSASPERPSPILDCVLRRNSCQNCCSAALSTAPDRSRDSHCARCPSPAAETLRPISLSSPTRRPSTPCRAPSPTFITHPPAHATARTAAEREGRALRHRSCRVRTTRIRIRGQGAGRGRGGRRGRRGS